MRADHLARVHRGEDMWSGRTHPARDTCVSTWDGGVMAQAGTPKHHDAERRMREIVRNAELPAPDEVRYEFDPDEVVLIWNETKLAVVIDLEDDGTGEIELQAAEERQPAPG